ncbi:MAG TPA: hypothetical protein VFS20_01365 [Longimicrobium sp.]|nr:hypothetical protein [Longimicrobium sp.]
MRKPLMFLIAAALLVVAAAFWVIATMEGVIGGKEIITTVQPEALLLLYGTLGLFAIALVVTITAGVRTWMHRAAPAETPAPPEENAPATS